jgi:SNF2 family DNA or RNA helicase
MKPFATKTELMAHQKEAVAKRLPVRVGGLFMEMQTGKTRTAIELAKLRAAKIDKVVWFTPVSLKLTVAGQIREHTDCEDICVFNDRTSQRNLPKDKRWYIIGTESMSSSDRVVLAANQLITDRTMVAMDESSYIKGHRAKRTERLTYICARSRYREILNGTPLSKGVVDLYSQMRFLSPKILGYDSFYSFEANHLEYSDRFPDMIVRAHNTEWLAAKIHPYVYQVRKKDCLDLPPQTYSTKYCSLTGEQREAYERLKEEFLMKVDLDDWDSHKLFQLFTGLQQVVSGFWTEKRRGAEVRHELNSERPELLKELIHRVPDDEPVIIWGKYLYDIEQICRALEGKTHVIYTGKQSEKERDRAKHAFLAGDVQFFAATAGTGGYGLTLMNASTQIFYTNSFKYIERDQAESRCHGIGQQRTVHYIDIVCENSIDEMIMASIRTKEDTLKSFQREVDIAQRNKERMKEMVRRL